MTEQPAGQPMHGASTMLTDDAQLQPVQSSGKQLWMFNFRPYDDNDEQDWWFASTAIPLVAATVGPLANVLSIAALVTHWRLNLIPNGGSEWTGGDLLPELQGSQIDDPAWCIHINIASLVCGFVGNFFLLANFTNRIRYIIALPVTILLWYLATAMLIAITLCMNIYVPPSRPSQTYSQGFWYAVIAATLYLICSMLLMANMLGYFLGHYPQHFILTESQRTLILQTMMFFIWLAGGAGVFANVETRYGHQGWLFTDALYFCDVTILTVGFGDLVPEDNVGRGIVFPYTVGGTIMLGLVISSLSRFAKEISSDQVIRKQIESKRQRTLSRSLRRLSDVQEHPIDFSNQRVSVSRPYSPHRISATPQILPQKSLKRAGTIMFQTSHKAKKKKSRAIVLKEERDRFNAMRAIQKSTADFKHWWALIMSVMAFAILWAVGAVVFWVAEHRAQGLSYFESLYFCYVSLLTIGYGDLAPKSNAGRPFFVVWSLLAVPMMTILVSDMGHTVIASFTRGVSRLADFTILPQYGIWRGFVDKHPWLLLKLQNWSDKRATTRRLKEGFQVEDDETATPPEPPTIDELANERPDLSSQEVARKLASLIRRAANDLKSPHEKRYTYEEWVEITEIIRITSNHHQVDGIADSPTEDEEGLIVWDWIGRQSPMMTGKTEPEFVLDRLCESMARYVKHQSLRGSHLDKSTEIS